MGIAKTSTGQEVIRMNLGGPRFSSSKTPREQHRCHNIHEAFFILFGIVPHAAPFGQASSPLALWRPQLGAIGRTGSLKSYVEATHHNQQKSCLNGMALRPILRRPGALLVPQRISARTRERAG